MKAFTVNSKDLFNKNKNPNLSLSAKDLLRNAAMPKSPYDKQAHDFLEKNSLGFKATFKGDKCPRWCNGKCMHGDRYWITISRRSTRQRIGFEFWNSVKDASNNTPVLPYAVLACISSEIHCPDDFDDFCRDYGYDVDSRRDLATFNDCTKLAKKLRRFFTDEEIEQLTEIS